MKNNRNALWAPDIIKESNGVACGDMLSVNAYRDNGKLFFSFSGNSCSVALKVSSFLEDCYSGKDEYFIKENIDRIRERQYNESETWIAGYVNTRKNCVDAPVNLLNEIINIEIVCDADNHEKNMLACDACVSTKTINWEPEIEKKNIINLKTILKEMECMDNPTEIELQKLGLCVLTQEHQELFQNRIGHISQDDFNIIKKLRLASPLFNNGKKYNLKLDPRIEELVIKQVVSLAVANEEIRNVDDFIKTEGLKVDAVKGVKTNQYYPKGYIRTHMDFDYLAADFKDAFKLISYLLNTRKFKLVIGGSVPFSFKSVINTEGAETLTGHIHLEKVLQDKYQVVIDINMGGFPLGRTGIIQCNNIGKLELEDLVCITVAHLFKHERAYIKDINDLYYLLRSADIDSHKLSEKVDKYGLTNLFSVTYDFLKIKMGLPKEIQVNPGQKMSEKRKTGWPFSKKSHFYIKAIDMLLLNIRQYGNKTGIVETINQICGAKREINSEKYNSLFEKLNERAYLYPIVIFNCFRENIQLEILNEVSSLIMIYKQILILPIGFFLIQNRKNNTMNRESLTKDIEFLLNLLRLNQSDCITSYVMEARKDTWLY